MGQSHAARSFDHPSDDWNTTIDLTHPATIQAISRATPNEDKLAFDPRE